MTLAEHGTKNLILYLALLGFCLFFPPCGCL